MEKVKKKQFKLGHEWGNEWGNLSGFDPFTTLRWPTQNRSIHKKVL